MDFTKSDRISATKPSLVLEDSRNATGLFIDEKDFITLKGIFKRVNIKEPEMRIKSQDLLNSIDIASDQDTSLILHIRASTLGFIMIYTFTILLLINLVTLEVTVAPVIAIIFIVFGSSFILMDRRKVKGN